MGGEGAAGKNSSAVAAANQANLANGAGAERGDNANGTEESKTDLRTAE